MSHIIISVYLFTHIYLIPHYLTSDHKTNTSNSAVELNELNEHTNLNRGNNRSASECFFLMIIWIFVGWGGGRWRCNLEVSSQYEGCLPVALSVSIISSSAKSTSLTS